MDLSVEVKDLMRRHSLKQLKLLVDFLGLETTGTKEVLAIAIAKRHAEDEAKAWKAISGGNKCTTETVVSMKATSMSQKSQLTGNARTAAANVLMAL